MKNVFKKAHELTKKIIKAGDNYRATFKLALIFVYSQTKKGVKVMVELVGSEKQVKWATDIRAVVLEGTNAHVEWKQQQLDENPNLKMRIRSLKKAKEINVRMQNEKSAKFFIENFAYIISKKQEEERIEKALKEKDVDYSAKYAISNSVVSTLNNLA